MALIDYQAVLADLEDKVRQSRETTRQLEAAIRGIKAISPTQRVVGKSVAAPTKAAGAKPRRGAFGRDLSQPTIADRVAVILGEHGPMHTSEIQKKLSDSGKIVTENVVRDVLTRKDKAGKFKKTERGVFALRTWDTSGNGALPM